MEFIPIDYETLKLIWWALLGILLIGFGIMGGMDLGVGTLLPIVARKDEERRVLLNLVGPTWEGNQVWLILGGGAIFAAWPPLYAVSFSGFYLAMMLALFALIIRPVGFKFRGKVNNPTWRAVWDAALFIGGFVPALVFGVAVGNVFLGAPFDFDRTMRTFYHGEFLQLFAPFALLCGLVSVEMLCVQGAVIIAKRTRGVIAERARKMGMIAAAATIVLFAIGGVWVSGMDGHVITSTIVGDAPANPLFKTVVIEKGAWFANYTTYPWMIAAPALGFIGMLAALVGLWAQRYVVAILGSSLGVAGIIATAGVSLFPFLLPSSHNPNMGLTVWDASSSHLTLFIMLIVTVIFIPLIILYTSWVYKVMAGPVTADNLDDNPNAY